MVANINFFIFRLKHVKGVGNKGLLKVINHCLTAGHHDFSMMELMVIAKISPYYRELFQKTYQETLERQAELYEEFLKGGFLTILDSEYPLYLREIFNPPVAFFYQGNLTYLQDRILAMVGAREMSDYGKQTVNFLIPTLVKEKITIASGLAKGIDTCVHQQVIRHQGRTIAVIGSGLDQTYPKENKRLQHYIGTQHLLISEYPRGTIPYPHHFPARNRLIAGIAKGTCIIEAKAQSGSLITAQLALEGGREVFAVPGSILTARSKGCHDLIQQGAKCVITGKDITEEYAFKKEDLIN